MVSVVGGQPGSFSELREQSCLFLIYPLASLASVFPFCTKMFGVVLPLVTF